MTLPNKHTKNVRLIARLDVKGPNLIKGIHLEGLRVIGDPAEHAQRYYEQGADEIIYLDIVASLYGRSNLKDIVQQTANDIFIPLTVGGGIRTIADVDALLKAGADKVAINTAGVCNPDLLTEVANTYGSQCLVLSIEAKRNGNSWEVYTDCGRESTGLDAIEWAIRGVELGAGEVLVTSIDQEGTRKGFDNELISAVADVVEVPVIACGGYGANEHLQQAVNAGADAVGFADTLHYNRSTFADLRQVASDFMIPVRPLT